MSDNFKLQLLNFMIQTKVQGQHHKLKHLYLVALFCLTWSAAQDITTIYDNQLFEGLTQTYATYKYFALIIGERYYDDNAHLVIKVIPEEFDSDPDLFISKSNMYPIDSSTSDWNCETQGGETCIIRDGEFKIGQTLYIGVRCLKDCQYKLYSHFTVEQQVFSQVQRQTFRFNSYTTNLLKYYIKKEPSKLNRLSVPLFITVKVEPEDLYAPLQIKMSYQKSFHNHNSLTQVLNSKLGVKFSPSDSDWCIDCWVYLIVTVEKDMRYYFNTESVMQEQDLKQENNRTLEVLVNTFDTQCIGYDVTISGTETEFFVKEFSGQAEVYISVISPRSTSEMKVFDSKPSPLRKLIVDQNLRKYLFLDVGHFKICFYGLSEYSAVVKARDYNYTGVFELENGVISNFALWKQDFFHGRFLETKILQKQAVINVYASVDVSTKDQNITVYYVICDSGKVEECSFVPYDVSQLKKVEGVVNPNNELNAQIIHNPRDCPDPMSCIYLFKIVNNHVGYDVFSLKVSAFNFDPQDVNLNMEYSKKIDFGTYSNFEINPGQNDFTSYIDVLKIKVETTQGETDLYASLSSAVPTVYNFDYQSRMFAEDSINQITIQDEGRGLFKKPIFFSIFGLTRADVRISFEYTLLPKWQEQLEKSTTLVEGIPYSDTILDELTPDRLYSFDPWWTGSEQRSTIFYGDCRSNKIFFYSKWNEYPQHYLSTLHDDNDIINIPAGDPQNRFNGTWYIRLRPDFTLYDLLSERQYIYNFYAFSQTMPTVGENRQRSFMTLQLGEETMGLVNVNEYMDYRFLQIDLNAKYVIKLLKVPSMYNQGKPVFYQKTIGGQDASARKIDYHYKSEQDATNSLMQILTLDGDMRNSRTPSCQQPHRSVNLDGTLTCYLSIAVTCNNNVSVACAYILKLTQVGVDSSIRRIQRVVPTPPPSNNTNNNNSTSNTTAVDLSKINIDNCINNTNCVKITNVTNNGTINANATSTNGGGSTTTSGEGGTSSTNNGSSNNNQTSNDKTNGNNGTNGLNNTNKLNNNPVLRRRLEELVVQFDVVRPPDFILQSEYTTDYLYKDQMKYYVFPLDVSKSPEVAILIVKTQVYGSGQNGNVKLFAQAQYSIDESTNYQFKLWNYPTEQKFDFKGNNENSDVDFIRPDAAQLYNKCRTLGGNDCALIIGVQGLTDKIASFRLKGFYSMNMLKLNAPTNRSTDSFQIQGSYYDTYWFSIPPGKDSFTYHLSVMTWGKESNPDLFVSLRDGRYPIQEDNDLSSVNMGADYIKISSDLPIWSERRWDFKQGLIAVVTVRKRRQNEPYLLMLNDQDWIVNNITRLKTGVAAVINQQGPDTQVLERTFMWYNWEHSDVSVDFIALTGSAIFMYSRAGQDTFENTIFSAVPRSQANAKQYSQIGERGTSSFQISGKDCYNCWYFFMVKVTEPLKAQYRITINKKPKSNADSLFTEMQLDVPIKPFIAAGYYDRRKFMLQRQDPFMLDIQTPQGAVEVYIGLNPENVGPSNYIWTATTKNGSAQLLVQSSDQDFHLATYYYVFIISISGIDMVPTFTLKQEKQFSYLLLNFIDNFQQRVPTYQTYLLGSKNQFFTSQEMSKNHIFKVKGVGGNSMMMYRVKIIIEGLTPHFYPIVYVSKYETQLQRPDQINFVFPNMNNYNIAFGENPFSLINQNKYEFIYEVSTASNWVFFLLTVYNNNWGLTDLHKSAYQIKVEVEPILFFSNNYPIMNLQNPKSL